MAIELTIVLRRACLALMLISAGCQKSPDKPAAVDAAAMPSNAVASGTATVLDGVNTSDTAEDASYAAPGEDLAQQAGADMIGKRAPPASFTTIDGQKIDLAKIYGKKPVYLKFWATWCVPCRQQMPAFEKVYETLGERMQVVAIDIGFNDDEASIRAFRTKYGLKMPIVLDDGRLGALFKLRVTPQHVLIGRDGRFAHVGHADNKALADAIQQVMSEKAPAHAVIGSAVAAEQVVKPGDRVRGLQISTTAGHVVSLGSNVDGRLRGVVFFSSWCEWYLATSRPATSKACARVREAVDALAARNTDVDWLGVAGGPWSTAKDLADYQAKWKRKIPIALDVSGTLFRSFAVRDIPTIALIDPSGRLLRIIGPDETDIAGAIKQAKSTIPAERAAR